MTIAANILLCRGTQLAPKCGMRHLLSADLSLVGRVLAFLIGFGTLYLACFLYEPEEGRWQNRIDAIWVAIDDRALHTDSKTTAILNTVAGGVARLITRLCGAAILSPQSIGVSVNCSLAAILAFIAAMSIPTPQRGFYLLSYPGLKQYCYVLSALCFSAAAAAAWLRRGWIVPFLTWLPCLVVSASLIGFTVRHLDMRNEIIWLTLVLGVSAASGTALVLVLRRNLAIASAQNAMRRILDIIASQVVYTCVLTLIPVLLAFIAPKRSEPFVVFAILLLFDASVLSITLVPLIGLLVVLLHRAFWPVAARLVYPLARHRVVSNRKAMIALSVLCFGHAFGAERKLLEATLKLVGGD